MRPIASIKNFSTFSRRADFLFYKELQRKNLELFYQVHFRGFLNSPYDILAAENFRSDVRPWGCAADAFTSKIIHSAKSAAYIILFPIVLSILAEPRRDSFASFRRHAMNDFVSDNKSLRVPIAVRRNGNLILTCNPIIF